MSTKHRLPMRGCPTSPWKSAPLAPEGVQRETRRQDSCLLYATRHRSTGKKELSKLLKLHKENVPPNTEDQKSLRREQTLSTHAQGATCPRTRVKTDLSVDHSRMESRGFLPEINGENVDLDLFPPRAPSLLFRWNAICCRSRWLAFFHPQNRPYLF